MAIRQKLRQIRSAGLVFFLLSAPLLGSADTGKKAETAKTVSMETGTRTADSEFVPFSLEKRETLSGKKLMLAAYAVIFLLLILYVFSIFWREKQVETEAKSLEKALKLKK